MVQVDVFWSYGLSAGLALAGHREIAKAKSWWENKTFLFSVLWIACIFSPSGIFLLWNFPAWETMFVAKNHQSIPGWLATLFAATNVTQGVLGFYVTAKWIRNSQMKKAIWQTVWSHGLMLFILVCGWDGTGWRRFFYPGTGEEWYLGVTYSWTEFFGSPVFYGLLALGAFFLPTYFGLIKVLRGLDTDPDFGLKP